MSPRIGSLFSGVGGLDIAVEAFFGGETVWHCEFDPEPSKVLAARWPGVPNLGDITTVDWATVEPVDILIGGFPCQDLSLAGRRSGMRPGTRSGLWADFKDAIRALSPSFVVIENVRGLLSGCAESESDSELGPCPRCVDPDSGVPHAPNVRALGRVLGDLADLGFDAEWCGLPASSVGAPHGRFRVFILAYRRGEASEFWTGLRPGETGGFGWGRPDDDARETGAPVALFRTPAAAELDGGRRNPDRPGATMRLRDQIAEEQERGKLLPTPAASNPNDGEGTETWLARRERVKAKGINGNGMGMPLSIAVQLLPTPVVTDAASARRHTTTTGVMHSGTSLTDAVIDPINWAEYEPAVRRWEALTRVAPAPTRPTRKGGAQRLSSLFTEWMMGYSAGWVTDVIEEKPAIRACGNGVVPQQAYAALDILWSRVIEAVAA